MLNAQCAITGSIRVGGNTVEILSIDCREVVRTSLNFPKPKKAL